MMRFDFANMDITTEQDWIDVKNMVNESLVDDKKWAYYRQLLARLNIIVGFGRGFYSGDTEYIYLTYHQDTQQFYWYIRNRKLDFKVAFYKIETNAKIFTLLETYPITDNFDLFDETLESSMLYQLSNGRTSSVLLPNDLKGVPLKEIFGEDTEELRDILVQFEPGSSGSLYPHTEFTRQFFVPAKDGMLKSQAAEYNCLPSHHVFVKDGSLWIRLGNDTFKLKEPTEI